MNNQNSTHMKKLTSLFFASLFAAVLLTACSSGTDSAAATDTSAVKTDTTAMPAVDTTKMDTANGRVPAEPVVPPKE